MIGILPIEYSVSGHIAIALEGKTQGESLDGRHASQIAELVNAHNQLNVRYDADRVLRSEGTYFFELSETGDVIACVELRRVQWYQLEIDHLTVAPAARARGHAFGLLQRCEAYARERGGRLLQCTIR
jgi:N-acetylglutamate synthase-like GNAT family acetyltransferase